MLKKTKTMKSYKVGDIVSIGEKGVIRMVVDVCSDTCKVKDTYGCVGRYCKRFLYTGVTNGDKAKFVMESLLNEKE